MKNEITIKINRRKTKVFLDALYHEGKHLIEMRKALSGKQDHVWAEKEDKRLMLDVEAIIALQDEIQSALRGGVK